MTPTVEEIQQRTASLCGISVPTMLSYDRTRRVSRARQLAMYAARAMTNASWRELAAKFQRDHTAIRQAVDIIDWHVWHTPGTDAVLREIGDWRRT